MRVGFIGTGTITAAILRGMKASSLQDWPVLVSPRNADVARELADSLPGVAIGADNQDVADRSDLVILAVRPQVAEEVLRGLRLRADQRVISLIAGLDHQTIAGWTGAGAVCRAIPLPFIAQGRDATPVYPPDPQAVAFFAALGQALPVNDLTQFNTFATLSALMASFFGIAELAADWAGRQGMASEPAQRYLGQLFGNLGAVLEADPTAVAQLRVDHATRGGLNEQVFDQFRRLGGEAALNAALDSVMARIRG